MERGYILSIDQSTQGTKAILLDGQGQFVLRRDLPHRQLISAQGWVGHDAKEIAENIIRVSQAAVRDSGIDSRRLAGVAVTNQRESVALWERDTGRPVCESIVWQCNRGGAVPPYPGTRRLSGNSAAYRAGPLPLFLCREGGLGAGTCAWGQREG